MRRLALFAIALLLLPLPGASADPGWCPRGTAETYECDGDEREGAWCEDEASARWTGVVVGTVDSRVFAAGYETCADGGARRSEGILVEGTLAGPRDATPSVTVVLVSWTSEGGESRCAAAGRDLGACPLGAPLNPGWGNALPDYPYEG